MSQIMGGLYEVISKILLFWHGLGDRLLPKNAVLGTNWQWILSIVFLVLTLRALLFPVFVKQIKSQRAMQALQPRMKELQEKHKGDRETMQKELMELYRAEKVNPMMGCLPMFVQVPVFISLFHVLRHLNPDMSDSGKKLYGWTIPLFDSASHARLFGAPIPAKFSSTAQHLASLDADGTRVKIVAAVLVLIMMTTTFLSSRQMILKTGWSDDPQQLMMQRLMLYGIPISLLFSGWQFPLGVIIYWVTNNLISLGQQSWVLHKYPPPNTNAGKGKSAAVKGGSAKGNGKNAGKGTSGTATKGGVAGASTKALAPKPGAKPVNPKKGGANKRQAG